MIRFGAPLAGFTWVKSSDGSIPPQAVQGGREIDGKPLYICRQWHKGGLQIGKTAPHLNGCYIAYGGKEVFNKECYVLCGPATQLRWIECKGKCVPKGWIPLEGGNEENGTELWIGKVNHDNSEQLGKVSPNWDFGCNFGYDSKEISLEKDHSYFVLAHL